MLYRIARAALFRLPAETSHDLGLLGLKVLTSLPGVPALLPRVTPSPVNLFGLHFENPVGLAAGLDKNGDYYNALGRLGFGFIEVGTVTPRPQAGNPKPRMFRLPHDAAVINRMGFNNKGVDYLVERLSKRRYQGVLGVNIGKNKDTPNDNAVDDYLHCLERVFPHADYITVNISSPNTPGLRDLQHGAARRELFTALKASQQRLANKFARQVPLLVKMAPDMELTDIDAFADDAIETGMDGVIATNTTNSRPGQQATSTTKLATGRSKQHRYDEQGGLSGLPLAPLAKQVHQRLGTRLAGRIPMISVGGISTAADAAACRDAGADLLQIYTGLIYNGPTLVQELADAWRHAALATRQR